MRGDQKPLRPRERVVVAAIAGAAAAFLSLTTPPYAPGAKTDFAWVWSGARAFTQGLNPYDSVGPGRLYPFWSNLWYPLPAILVGVPFSLFSLEIANALFLGTSTALLVWGLTARPNYGPKLLLFISFAWYSAVLTAQWSPLMTAAALTPAFGFLLVCKPTLGLALFAAFPSTRALVGSLLFLAITLVLWPWWVPSWLLAIQTTHQMPAVTLWGGPIVLLALMKWRRPEARLLVAMCCVPLTANLYEAVPLFLIVSTWKEAGVLGVLCSAVYFGAQAPQASLDREVYLRLVQQWMVLLIYVPCTLMVLRRPNEGTLPSWLDWSLRRVSPGGIPDSPVATPLEDAVDTR